MKLLLLLALMPTLDACQNPSRVLASLDQGSVRDQSEDGRGSWPQLQLARADEVIE
jgi:hypothetical protein